MQAFNIAEYKSQRHNPNKVDMILTESPTLNEYLGGGLRTGNLVVLEAPSGIGKSTIMQRLFIRGLMGKKKVAYLSIGEQDQKEIAERIACMFKNIEYDKFDISRTDDDFDKIEEFLENNYNNYYICYSDDPWGTVETDEETGKPERTIDLFIKNAMRKDIHFIFIDYLGAIMPPAKETAYAYLTKVATELKTWCTDNNLMIFTAMQTNKQFKIDAHQPNFDPENMDEVYMQDSIGPARKATICLGLGKKKDNYYLNVFKNRLNGKLGLINFSIKPITYKWDELFGKDGF